MRRKGIPIVIGILSLFGMLHIMCFILKSVSISRITCDSVDQALMQNSHHLLYIVFSIVGVLLLSMYYKRLRKTEE